MNQSHTPNAEQTANQEAANAIRFLAIDAVQQANSGHPGAPMGLADVMAVLWRDWIKHNPTDPLWQNRDRFVLSNGHGSMLLYAALHLSGYALPIEEIRHFRQLHSKTPGHPEVGMTPGVEVTTGPLGQGFAMAVGMAMAEKILAAHFNVPDLPVIDHHTWVLLGDGCLMEGISHEAASLAGVHQLGKLIAIYDDNGISIDGKVDAWLKDDTPMRFCAYGWHVIPVVDGHDPSAVEAALAEAKQVTDRPSLICAQTHIGFGSPNKQDQAAAHGAALGEEEVVATRLKLGWQHAPFVIPEHIYEAWDCRASGDAHQQVWQGLWSTYSAAKPELAEELQRRWAGDLPEALGAEYQSFTTKLLDDAQAIASRGASKNCLNVIAPRMPELFGGSADLSDSCSTKWSGAAALTPEASDANYIYYGVREFAMTAIANGICLHGGLRPYTGTFLTFSDYARNAVRMAALMQLPQILIYTHDSILLGEDGPTHQPIEHLSHLRSTPGLSVWRPADAVETAVAWQAALERRTGPIALVLSRQKLAAQAHNQAQLEEIRKGGYILVQEAHPLQIILISSGSEVDLAVQAAAVLSAKQIGVRVVSMPSADTFETQRADWQEAVLPAAQRCRLAIEAAHPDYWRKWVGLDGAVLGISGFGASAPMDDLTKMYNLLPARVVAIAQKLLK